MSGEEEAPAADGRGDRDAWLVLAGAVALLLAILLAAVLSIAARPGPGGEAAKLVPATALAYARLSTDRGDAEVRRLQRIAPRIPGYVSLRDSALNAVSPAPGAFDPRRDVQPWLGDEAAVALVDVGGGRFASLVLAQVRSKPRAEALLQRVAGEEPAVRYRGTLLRRFGGSAAAFSNGFLLAGPEGAVRRSLDVADGKAPALADAKPFQAALEGARHPLSAYLSPRGLRSALRARGGVPAVIGGLLDRPRLRAVGAGLSAEARSLRASARLTGAGGSATRLRLLAGVPATAVALVTGPDFARAVGAAQRAGAGGALASVRATLSARAGLDLDRDVLARLRGEFALWLEPGAAAPVITLAARTRDPAGARVALARAQTPVARSLAEQAGAKISFQSRTIAGADAFTLPVSPAFSPTYAVVRDTVLLSTSPTGLGNFLARRPRLVAATAFRAAMPARPARAEGLAYADGRRLLAIAEQTGLDPAALPRIGSAGAVLARDGDDATAELAVGLP